METNIIIRSNKHSGRAGSQDELVSTSDIYSIILHACGLESKEDLENKYLDSILPPSLEGKIARLPTLLNTENHSVIEWVKRYDHAQGEYKTTNIDGKQLEPILEFINDIEGPLSAKFMTQIIGTV